MDSKKPRDLEKLVRFCRKNGITSLKDGEFAIELAPSALFPESEYKKKKALENNDPIITETSYTEEDTLFWSSAGIPDEKVAN